MHEIEFENVACKWGPLSFGLNIDIALAIEIVTCKGLKPSGIIFI